MKCGTYEKYLGGCDCPACTSAFLTRCKARKNLSWRGRAESVPRTNPRDRQRAYNARKRAKRAA